MADQLIPPWCDAAVLAAGSALLAAGRSTAPLLYAVEAAGTDETVLLTPTALLCVRPDAPATPRWEVGLGDILLIQRRNATVCLLCHAPEVPSGAGSGAGSGAAAPRELVQREVQAPTNDAAAALHEVIRVAQLNCARLPFPSSPDIAP
jgi:hypothetical protein